MAYDILMVDDSRTTKAVIAKSLGLSGLALGVLREAGNGREGLDILRREHVDLVFADLNMPVMGGMEMVAEMKADAVLRAIPIVVISTEGSETRIQELLERGVAAFLRKPFRPEMLKRVVEDVLGGSRG
jgi:two-component system chemotaxis response regulator CheY